jgi:hypothetical protein
MKTDKADADDAAYRYTEVALDDGFQVSSKNCAR